MSEEFKRTPEEWVAHYQNHYINTLTAEASSRIIKNDMTNVARSCISIGFHLKAVRDRKLFREMGYGSLWEYAADQFGLSMSSASRYIAINDQFSVGGNTPQLQPEYRNFSKSQLQEMLDHVAELESTKGNICQFVDRSKAYHRAGDGEAVPCCKDCENLCEYACGKTKKALKEMGLPSPEETDQETVQLSDMDLLQSMLDEAKGQLSEYLKVDKVEKLPEEMIRKKKILVGALAAMKCDLDNAVQDKPEKPEQPELPIMKNNDQRKEWLRNYRDWGLWYEDENIGVKYYKYDFENGARLIAEVYEGNERKRTFTAVYLHLVGGPEPPKHPKYGYGKWNRHEQYDKHPDSETELVEFLKEVQKCK